jgi:hypothetical protein
MAAVADRDEPVTGAADIEQEGFRRQAGGLGGLGGGGGEGTSEREGESEERADEEPYTVAAVYDRRRTKTAATDRRYRTRLTKYHRGGFFGLC